MRLRKIAAIALCVALVAALASSCAKKEGVASDGRDYDAAYSAFEPGTVMITAGDSDVTWDVLYYFICMAIDEAERMTGGRIDWDAAESGLGFRDQIMSRAADFALGYKAVEYGARLNGAVLTEDDRASIALSQETAEEQLGGHAEFLAYLKDSHMSYEVFIYLLGIDYLYENAFTAVYGEGAENFPDARVAEYIGDVEYFAIKHILLSSEEDAGAVLAQLEAHDGADFDAYFDELMRERSEDTSGVNLYPDGYLFTAGQMVPGLEAAALGLKIGGLSGVVETDSGYHIVYRIPVSYDTAPQGYPWDPRNTLRAIAAREDFSDVLEGWRIEMKRVDSDAFQRFDIAKVFK
ncbi:MAG: peptidylprolyl isomerase [Oscillospiraceae bacterium]|jgi:parvulin-like peptidyl-prolyl isomerase|nr:peptidylprolyl isomerase [Oscillospiraceae bacterium]